MSFPDSWPGVGDVPEPEADGFREEQIEKVEEIRLRKLDEAADRSKEQKEFFSGKAKDKPAKAAPTPPAPVAAKA